MTVTFPCPIVGNDALREHDVTSSISEIYHPRPEYFSSAPALDIVQIMAEICPFCRKYHRQAPSQMIIYYGIGVCDHWVGLSSPKIIHRCDTPPAERQYSILGAKTGAITTHRARLEHLNIPYARFVLYCSEKHLLCERGACFHEQQSIGGHKKMGIKGGGGGGGYIQVTTWRCRSYLRYLSVINHGIVGLLIMLVR